MGDNRSVAQVHNFCAAVFPQCPHGGRSFTSGASLALRDQPQAQVITGDERKSPIRRLLLRSGSELDFFERATVNKWLEHHPELRKIHRSKEALHGLYRIKATRRAARALTAMTERFGQSHVTEIRALRRTLMSWRAEILASFETGPSNDRVEGFNGKAKLVRMRAYGYRSFKNYRLRLLNACA